MRAIQDAHLVRIVYRGRWADLWNKLTDGILGKTFAPLNRTLKARLAKARGRAA